MSGAETLEGWVYENCESIQGPLETADSALWTGAQGSGQMTWACAKAGCPVIIETVQRKRIPGYKARLKNPEQCLEIPPLDQPL